MDSKPLHNRETYASKWTFSGSGSDNGLPTAITATQWLPGALPPRDETDHSPPSIAEDKNEWSYNYAPPIRHHDVLLG